MKKSIIKKLLAFSLSALLCFSLIACSGDSEKTNGSNVEAKIESGVWTDKTFKNESANIEFTIDNNAHVLTTDELKQNFSISKNIAINDENGFSEEEYDKSEEFTLYDCMIRFPDNSNVIVSYTKLSKATKNLDAKSFQQNTIDSVENLEIMNYTFKNFDEATVAGETYTTAEMSIDYQGIIQKQMYYTKKEPGFFITFIFTAPESGSPYQDQFMNSVKHIK